MTRMERHHHKAVLTLTTLLLTFIGVLIGVQIDTASGGDALIILIFAFTILLIVLIFITLAIVLTTREELYELHAQLRKKIAPKKTKKR